MDMHSQRGVAILLITPCEDKQRREETGQGGGKKKWEEKIERERDTERSRKPRWEEESVFTFVLQSAERQRWLCIVQGDFVFLFFFFSNVCGWSTSNSSVYVCNSTGMH